MQKNRIEQTSYYCISVLGAPDYACNHEKTGSFSSPKEAHEFYKSRAEKFPKCPIEIKSLTTKITTEWISLDLSPEDLELMAQE